MDRFWSMLARLNARAVLYATVAGLLCALTLQGYRAWRWRRCAVCGSGTRPAESARPRQQSVPAVIRAELIPRSDAESVSPFWSSTLDAILARVSKQPAAPAPRPAPPEPVVPKPREERVLKVLYRGMLLGTDGQRLALLEESTTKASGFYAVGDRIAGLRVESIETARVALVLRDGATLELTPGREQTVKETGHAK